MAMCIFSEDPLLIRKSHPQEDLDLDALAREAVASSSSQIQISSSKAPIAVLVKSPCLAIRYPTRVNQIRRFQLKFTSDADYRKAVSILSEVGCPITESTAGSFPPSTAFLTRPNTASWPHSTASPVLGMPSSQAGSHSIRAVPATVPETRPSTIGSSSALGTTQPSRNTQVMNKNARSEYENSSERPSTAPIFLDAGSLIEQLPPKRELPFAKPQRRQQRYIPPKQTMGITANSIDLRLNPQTHGGETPPPESSIQASMTRLDSEGIQSPVARSAMDSIAKSDVFSTGTSTSFTPSSISTLGAALEIASDAAPVKAAQSILAESRTSTELADKDGNIIDGRPNPARSAVQLLPQTSNLSYSASSNPPQIPSQQSHIDSQPNISTVPVTSNLLTTTDLSSYLSTPTTERSALVESWVCQQLESDGFLALCQDVECVWKRIAFGL
ncbi:hypothetical protein CPC735_051370 [Coccidioides posadasii C735 delta SOWgp]|uniref:Uncharacterized protein n=1 Tax=Coccidioides posadasii (strain C735) TaxID=222929 RepID=C5PGW4_COCP7|nr:hypothetical protein CPC735_051370 [Coccidioides posadasii C735 delta SOWgp]EER23767.1 hypothetical protein CPC735_051370 [Coccidioides posadasii C735 delta SOWgp]|eukprot:XP_003065912.1 hypothetical protein CPC735_051370 [Coccidioides posadasii C735 delta SOWgp]